MRKKEVAKWGVKTREAAHRAAPLTLVCIVVVWALVAEYHIDEVGNVTDAYVAVTVHVSVSDDE